MISHRSPIQKYPFYMLIETSGSNNDHDEEKLNKFLETAMSSSLVVDGFVTNEPSKMKVSSNAKALISLQFVLNQIH